MTNGRDRGQDLEVEFQAYGRMLLPDDCNRREKQPDMTNGDNARVTGQPPTPNPARDLARAQGGELTAENAGKYRGGTGAIFRLRLPGS